MRKVITLVILPVVSLLTGCASIVDGTSQKISVQTPPVTGAACTFQNNKGEWFLKSTPGIVSVHRSNEALLVACQKAGYQTASQTVKSTTKGMLAGNLVFGGLIGGGIDTADGAAFDYPTQINVPMKK